ncbi:MAG: biopolymer transporter ExbD [Planctomycetaceae bacterium]|nr:biopolymer transporter ExbD [Planctomycetaceae bacterium]
MVAMPAQNRDRSLGFNMTPMIDVVFLLIIFFLISSHLTRQEQQVKLALPIAKSGAHPTQLTNPRLIINLLADGRVVIQDEDVTQDMIGQRIGASLERLEAKDRENFEVRIRCARQTPYEFVQPILTGCVQQGIWNVTFAVYSPEEAPAS